MLLIEIEMNVLREVNWMSAENMKCSEKQTPADALVESVKEPYGSKTEGHDAEWMEVVRQVSKFAIEKLGPAAQRAEPTIRFQHPEQLKVR